MAEETTEAMMARLTAPLSAPPVEYKPPQYDQASFEATAQKWRDDISEHDPKSVYYQRPDLAAKARADLEQRISIARAQSGFAPEPVLTPAQKAEAEFEAQWPSKPPSADELKPFVDAIAAEDVNPHRAADIRALERELSPAGYASLIAAARAGLPDGVKWSAGVETCLPALKYFAAIGRRNIAYQHAKTAFRANLARQQTQG